MTVTDATAPHNGDALDILVYSVDLHYTSTSPRALGFHYTFNYTFDPFLGFNTSSVVACIVSGSALSVAALRGGACPINDTVTPVSYSNASVQFQFYSLDANTRFQAIFEATLLQTVQPEQILMNFIDYSFDSSPFTSPPGRFYDLHPVQITVVDAPRIDLSVIEASTSDVNTITPNVTIEETFVISILLTMPEVNTNVSLAITIPFNFQLLNATIDFLGYSLQQNNVHFGDVVNTSPYFTYAGDILSVDFGQINNIADNLKNANDTIAVRGSRQLCMVQSCSVLLL